MMAQKVPSSNHAIWRRGLPNDCKNNGCSLAFSPNLRSFPSAQGISPLEKFEKSKLFTRLAFGEGKTVVNARLVKGSESWHLLAFSPDLRLFLQRVEGFLLPAQREGELLQHWGNKISNPPSPPLATFSAINVPGKLAEKTANNDHMIARHVTTGHKCE